MCPLKSEMLRAPRGELILKTLIFLAATDLKYKVPKNVLAKMEENLNLFLVGNIF